MHTPYNELAGTPYTITVTSPGSASGARTVGVTGWPAGWTVFPTYVAAVRGNQIVGQFEATGYGGGNLSISGPAGYADAALQVGDTLEVRMSAEFVAELQTALATLTAQVALLAPLASPALTGTPTIAGAAVATQTWVTGRGYLANTQYASTAQAAFPGYTIVCWGDSLTAGAGGTPYPTQLTGLAPRNCVNEGVGGETSAQIATRLLAAPAMYADSVVIWAGRNDIVTPFTDTTTVPANVAAMVAALGHTRYLVLSILDEAVEILGTAGHAQVLAINATLASTYPNNYIDIRSYLISQYNPSIPQDVTDHANDVTPSSLRSDSTHLNTAGYALVAQQILARIDVLDGAPVPLKPASLAWVKQQYAIGQPVPGGSGYLVLYIDPAGNLAVSTSLVYDGATGTLGTHILTVNASGMFQCAGQATLASTSVLFWSATTDPNATADLGIGRVAAGVLIVGNALGGMGAILTMLDTLADVNVPNGCIFYGSDHLDGAGAAKLCRKDGAGNVTVIG